MEPATMARSPCSAISQASLPSAPLVPGRLAIRPRRGLALSNPAAARRLVARCAAGDKAEAETPIEKRFPPFPTVMDINQIRDILPHRFPFLLVDRVIDYKPGEYAVAIKNAMAEVGGIVMLQPEVGGSRENFFFAGIDKVRFRKPVIAGDTLVMRMTLIKLQKRFGITKMEGKAYVGADLVCEGEFLMASGSE
ncbi:hypothetical protein SEVIR_3G234400v4 [Setaria viridis]|uniref:Beta-hydroxyacyl-ACP dehydratase n=1 Tax=Setaria viridis TaxID=4556 RepID=A0A4U6VFB3_SETVI|nr:hypothetical protein SEVIR_3G234400v2 [Setaria viridis]